LRDHFPNGVFENEDIAPGARASKSVIDLKVDREYPDIHSGETLIELNVVRRYSLRAYRVNSKGRPHMSIISWIILGLIAGFIGSKIVNAEGQGFWLNIALGIIGALVGGFLFDFFGATGITGLNIWSIIVAIVGSVVVLWAYNALMARRA
jgi:uncharacterized membrane protein YeaQ/YmgE (transglycosylase-associated protein family)